MKRPSTIFPQLVSNYDPILKNVCQYNGDLYKMSELQDLLSNHCDWYYSEELELFAPSKFIGYSNMTGELYLKNHLTKLDGRKSEKALSEYSRDTINDDEFNVLSEQLIEFLLVYRKNPRSNFQLFVFQRPIP